MKDKKLIYKILFGASLLNLVIFLVIIIADLELGTGPFLTLFFVFLALSFNGFDKLSSFSYTVWIFAAVTTAMYFPQYFIKAGTFEFKSLIVPLLQIIMFGMGSQMSVKDFAGVIKMPKGVIVGIICQFTIMPIVGISLAKAFGFGPEVAAGIVLVGSSPSGLASNVMSFIAKANIALSVTLTACATMLAPLMTPFLMKILAGQMVPIDFWNMMLGIVNMVILPIVAGLMFNAISYGKASRRSIVSQAISYFVIIFLKNLIFYLSENPGMSTATSVFVQNLVWFLVLPIIGGLAFKKAAGGSKDFLDKALAFISMAGIAVIITIITANGRDKLIDVGLLLILACLMHNTLGYFLGYWASKLLRMDEQSCRTIALEVGMQNGGLASGIAIDVLKNDLIALAPAIFGPMMNITGSSLATYWRGKEIKDKK